MAAKAQNKDQLTRLNGQAVTTTLNGQQRKMMNLTEFPKIKTVLAPNAPWPKAEIVEKKTQKKREVGKKTVIIAPEEFNLDYFKQAYEDINKSKIAIAHRNRDRLSGKFLPKDGLAKS